VTGRTSIDTQSRPCFVASGRVPRRTNDIPLNTPGPTIHYKALSFNPRAALCLHFLYPSTLLVNQDMRNVDISNARVLEKITGPTDIRVIPTQIIRASVCYALGICGEISVAHGLEARGGYRLLYIRNRDDPAVPSTPCAIRHRSRFRAVRLLLELMVFLVDWTDARYSLVASGEIVCC
jgi:hypothetical protein